MANFIKNKKPAEVSIKINESQKIFVDREIQRDVFKENLGKILMKAAC